MEDIGSRRYKTKNIPSKNYMDLTRESNGYARGGSDLEISHP
jgi:hypothetical protein